MKIGFFGLGKTGMEAILPFLADKRKDVAWVLKRSARGAAYASDYHFLKKKQGKIYPVSKLNAAFLKKNPVDVVIDFSNHENVKNYALLAAAGVKIVSAVSSYNAAEKKLLDAASKETAVLWSPNITIGVNILITMSKLIKKLTPEADVQIVESHFSGKKGKSGTSLKMAEALNMPAESVHSIRAGGILSKHQVIFGYPYQTISMSHDAISRRAFGRGALVCADWLKTKTPGLYDMEDIFVDKMKEIM